MQDAEDLLQDTLMRMWQKREQLTSEHVNEAMSIIKKEAYEKLLQISEPDNKVDIYFKDGKKNSIIVMVNGEKNQTVLIVFSGTFTTSSIAKIFQDTK